MKTTFLVITSRAFEMNSPTGYAIGAVIAMVILGYLLYSLVKPEKF
jgi:K+-transporting ATPase KdpF subunit